MIGLGTRSYGLAAIALGLVGLVWGDFAAVWQPVPPDVPGRLGLAYAAALLFVAGGAALQLRRPVAVAAGAWLLAALHLVFALLWARRVIGFPEILGAWSGFSEPVVMMLGAVMAYACLRPVEEAGARRLALCGRLVFGLCLLVFGAAHFVYVEQTAAMVPAWLPPSRTFWAQLTGACHVLAGLALITGVQARMAARLHHRDVRRFRPPRLGPDARRRPASAHELGRQRDQLRPDRRGLGNGGRDRAVRGRAGPKAGGEADMIWRRRVLGFLSFCVGAALLAALAVLLTGNGILVRETVSEGKLSCRYLTLRGVVTREFGYGDLNFGRWHCDIVADPSRPF